MTDGGDQLGVENTGGEMGNGVRESENGIKGIEGSKYCVLGVAASAGSINELAPHVYNATGLTTLDRSAT